MKLIRERCCCFTGHRLVPAAERAALRARLRAQLLRLSELGVDTFLAGGAVGFDTLAAQEVLRLKEEQPWVYLVLALPCLGQEARWSERDVAVYRSILARADESIYTGDLYSREAMLRRDRYLVDHSAHCVCYLKSTRRGGTAYTVGYAKREGLEIVNLAAAGEEDWPQLDLFFSLPPAPGPAEDGE